MPLKRIWDIIRAHYPSTVNFSDPVHLTDCPALFGEPTGSDSAARAYKFGNTLLSLLIEKITFPVS